MTQFQSVFKHELAEYLEISQGTVSDDTLRSTRRTLFSFDSLLVAENADRVTETAINAGKILHCYGDQNRTGKLSVPGSQGPRVFRQ